MSNGPGDPRTATLAGSNVTRPVSEHEGCKRQVLEERIERVRSSLPSEPDGQLETPGWVRFPMRVRERRERRAR
jgi:hypothetical protein